MQIHFELAFLMSPKGGVAGIIQFPHLIITSQICVFLLVHFWGGRNLVRFKQPTHIVCLFMFFVNVSSTCRSRPPCMESFAHLPIHAPMHPLTHPCAHAPIHAPTQPSIYFLTLCTFSQTTHLPIHAHPSLPPHLPNQPHAHPLF